MVEIFEVSHILDVTLWGTSFFFGAVTGITASSDSIEEQAGISMALLAGKAIMSLTLIWGVVVAFGSHDLSLPPTSTSSDLEQDSKPFSLTGCYISSSANFI